VPLIADLAQRGADFRPRDVAVARWHPVVLADVEMAQVLACSADRLGEEILFDVDVECVEHHGGVGAAHFLHVGDGFLARVEQILLEAVDDLHAEGDVVGLGSLHSDLHAGHAAIPVRALVAHAGGQGSRPIAVDDATQVAAAHLADPLRDLLQEGDPFIPDGLFLRGQVIFLGQPDAVRQGDIPVVGVRLQRPALLGGHLANRAAVYLQQVEPDVGHLVHERVEVGIPVVCPVGVVNPDLVHIVPPIGQIKDRRSKAAPAARRAWQARGKRHAAQLSACATA